MRQRIAQNLELSGNEAEQFRRDFARLARAVVLFDAAAERYQKRILRQFFLLSVILILLASVVAGFSLSWVQVVSFFVVAVASFLACLALALFVIFRSGPGYTLRDIVRSMLVYVFVTIGYFIPVVLLRNSMPTGWLIVVSSAFGSSLTLGALFLVFLGTRAGLYIRRFTRRYPILQMFWLSVDTLHSVRSAQYLFASPRNAVSRLNNLADSVSTLVPLTAQLAGIENRDLLLKRANNARSAIRQYGLWLALRKHDTDSQIQGALEDLVFNFTMRRLDSLPVLPEVEKFGRRSFIQLLIRGLASTVAAVVPFIAIFISAKLGYRIPDNIQTVLIVAAIIWFSLILLATLDPFFNRRVTSFLGVINTMRNISS